MNYLHLDKNFTLFGTSIQYDAFVFNGGEPHIRINGVIKGPVMITQRVCSFNDFGLVLTATDALKRMGIDEISLYIPYFPAARQDRLMTKGEALTVKIYADIINAQGYKKVMVFDPHSEVTPALLNNVEVVTNYEFVKSCVNKLKGDIVLISPDGGALKKVYKLSKYLGGIEVIECSKKRDVKTGELTEFKVYEDTLEGKHAIIVDDICDGGGTFLGLGEALKAKGVKELSLIVSHGIFSKGVEELSLMFNNIFTTNSFKDVDGIDVIKLG